MPRQPTGNILRQPRADGSITYTLRVTYNGEPHTVSLGNSNDGWNEVRVEETRRQIAAEILLGHWRPTLPGMRSGELTIRELAGRQLVRRESSGLAKSTIEADRGRFERHVIPFFGHLKPSEIDVDLVEEYRDHKREENKRIRAAAEGGTPLRDPESGARLKPLANETINKTLRLLAALLDEALDREWVTRNVARGPRRREPVKRKRGEALDHRELEVLLVAAADLDRPRYKPETMERAAEIRRLRAQPAPCTWKEIARRVGVAESTAIYLHNRPSVAKQRPYSGVRRAVIAVLGLAGLRATEAADLDEADVQLPAASIYIDHAKTSAGEREVDIHGRLREELASYRTARGEEEPDAPALPTRTGGRRDKDNINKRVIQPVVKRANELLADRGLPPIRKHVTPHTLRRTYATLMLTAGYDAAYVMEQLGHESAKTTLEIYARVIRHPDRQQLRKEVRAFLEGVNASSVGWAQFGPLTDSVAA
jgi:integrase